MLSVLRFLESALYCLFLEQYFDGSECHGGCSRDSENKGDERRGVVMRILNYSGNLWKEISS